MGHGTHVTVSFSSEANDPIHVFYLPTIDNKAIIGAKPGNQFNISDGRTTSLSPLIGCLGALGLLLMIVSLRRLLYLVHTYLKFIFFYLVVVETLCTDGHNILTLSLGGVDGWMD